MVRMNELLADVYTVRKAVTVLCREHVGPQDLSLDWSGACWANMPSMTIDQFLKQSSNHRPVVELKLQYSDWGLYGLFRVQDQYVRCTQTSFQDRVCRDSCVEIYFQPFADKVPAGREHAPYLNLEMSGNGTLLSFYIRDARRQGDGFRDYEELSPADGEQVLIRSTLPEVVEPEIEEPVEWRLGFFLPFAVMRRYLGPLTESSTSLSGHHWRANAFKCADESSHPHWCSWRPCSEFNFHLPADFGYLLFE